MECHATWKKCMGYVCAGRKKKSKIYVKKENCRKLCIVHYILCEKNPTSTRPPSAALEPVVRLHRQPLLSPPEHCQQCGAVPLFCSFFRSSWSSNIRLFSPKTVFPHLLAPPSLYHMAKSNILQFRSVQSLSCVRLFATTWTTARQASLSITNSGVYLNSCPVSRWCHPTISSSVVPFSFYPQSFPASGFFQRSHFFESGGQSTGVSASTSILPMNTQDWSPLGWTGWISLQSKGLSRVFSDTTVQKHQFFSAQLSL